MAAYGKSGTAVATVDSKLFYGFFSLHPQPMQKGESQVMAGMGSYKGVKGVSLDMAELKSALETKDMQIQELRADNAAIKADNAAMKQELAELKAMVMEMAKKK